MADGIGQSRNAPPVAVVGLACRFPDADDAPGLLDAVLTGRRAFRRIPPVRLDLADYYQPDRAITDATYSTRAALIEGWQFDCAAFGITPAEYAAADPALWLALETTARALAGAGLAGGTGLDRDWTGVIIGNTLGGDTARAHALRARWPYVRRVLTDALASKVPAGAVRAVLSEAEEHYLAPFPAVGPQTRDSGPAGIAAAISAHFGFRGTGFAIDAAGASSLQAVATACMALAAGELDVAIAGGVDVSLDPQNLIRLAKAGLLARGDVRVYDEHPTGWLPAEGCGVVVLMRTADARAAGLPIYAEIAGWGMSSVSRRDGNGSHVSSPLLAMRRAYERAGVDPSDVQLFEGTGASTRADDDSELTALSALRSAARPGQLAVLGSVTANIGHAGAASGIAGLIKAVLSVSTGVLPPATGVVSPNRIVSSGAARLTLPDMASEWPDGARLAGVSSLDSHGANVHLVLRGEPSSRRRLGRWPLRGLLVRSMDDNPVLPRLLSPVTEPLPFLFQAADRITLTAVLSRVAAIARWLSDGELSDLACQLGREPDQQVASERGLARVALVAAGQEQLAALAAEAAGLLAGIEAGRVVVRPGIFASDGADGRVALLLSDGPHNSADSAVTGGPADTVGRILAALRWLESLDVTATGAVMHGLGTLAGLAWAGVLGERDVLEIATLRAEVLAAEPVRDGAQGMSTRHVRRDGLRAEPAELRAALAQKYRFGQPRRQLISSSTGTGVDSVDGAIDLVCTGLSGTGKLAEAVSEAALGASLLVETGPGHKLTATAVRITSVPAVSLQAGPGDYVTSITAAAALFAAGALGQPRPLFAGWSSRPIDIWRDQTFISSPCEVRAAEGEAARSPGAADSAEPAESAESAPPESAPPESAPSESGPHAAAAVPATASTDTDGTHSLAEVRGEFERRPPAQDARAGAAAAPPGQAAVTAWSGPDRTPGLHPWARCFAETFAVAQVRPQAAAATLPWRLHVTGGSTILAAAARTFRADDAAPRTLAIVGDPADSDSLAAALRAARDAVVTGELVVLAASAGFTGFFAGLQAEHPGIGVTVIRGPVTPAGVAAASRLASAKPGTFRELVLADDGVVLEPQMAEASLPAGRTFPLGPDDVVLVSRGASGAGLALAHVLACCGTPVAVIGHPAATDDSALVAGLEELRSAGARVCYQDADIDDAAAVADAISRIESSLGPVTAIGHAIAPSDPVPFAGLSDSEISRHAAAEAAVLDRLVSSLGPGQLRLIVTFGSVAGRYGLAGSSLLALTSGALAGRGEQLARTAGDCRSLHVDLPAWASSGAAFAPASASGADALEVPVAARLLLKIMTTPGLPDRVAVHGRIAGPRAQAAATVNDADLAAAGLPAGGRFLQDVRVYYPAVELICEPAISMASDPYLANYQVDGIPVLPGVLALEALAQAASVLAGRPLRHASAVRLESSIVVPAGGAAHLRLCAQREGSVVTAVLRCADSSFAVDHARAEFPCLDDAGDGTSQHSPAPSTLSGVTTSATGLVDGTELYGSIAFQTGRFRRIALLPEVTARSCRALARGPDDQPWFEPGGPLADTGFLLGSPGLNDAMLQALQACVPHRRVRPAACESVQFCCRATAGPVEIRALAELLRPGQASATVPGQSPAPAAEMRADSARQKTRKSRRPGKQQVQSASENGTGAKNGTGAVAPAGTGARAAPDGQQAPSADLPPADADGGLVATQAWTVKAVDAAGQLIAIWRGVRLRDCGTLPRTAAWPPALLSVYLERRAADLGLDDSLRATVSSGQAEVLLPAFAADAIPRQSGPAGSGNTAPAKEPGGRASLPGGPASPASPASQPGDTAVQARGRQSRSAAYVATAVGAAPLAGFTLTVRAASPVACGWAAAEPGHRQQHPAAAMAAVYARLRAELGEAPAMLTARLEAVAGCLRPDEAEHLTVSAGTSDGWVALQAGEDRLACAVVEVRGVGAPVAIAIRASQAARGPRRPAAARAKAALSPAPGA